MGSRHAFKKLWRKIHELDRTGDNSQSPDRMYENIKKIDGTHPLRSEVGNMHVDYQARQRPGGKVSFFNFELAKEMQLIGRDHNNEIPAKLEKALLETFSIIVINEYDLLHERKFDQDTIKPNPFMATRYLQLQHPNKQGKTSGDGRSLWNGCFENEELVWDIMSCGTGATKLSPATNIQKRFFESGDPSISYGCGYSEMDEALGTLFFSEVLHANGIVTERVLAIIEFDDDIVIRVRAHPNLLRPSHFFRLLKMGMRKELSELFDYHIKREVRNGHFPRLLKNRKIRYNHFLKNFAITFATMAAKFESEYIFCWLDWDGDNILMDGGIIDYGSIRQFGMFHHEYRYDDDDRYSTSITEQKKKSRDTVKTFAQAVHFALTGKRKPAMFFNRHPSVRLFDRIFEERKDMFLVLKTGLSIEDGESLLADHGKAVSQFRKIFSLFERAKSVRGIYNVTDGINCDAIFCMRDILRELPQIYLVRQTDELPANEFMEIMKSSYATPKDTRLTSLRVRQIRLYQRCYNRLLNLSARRRGISREMLLLEMSMRSSVINKYDRVTGDSITIIIENLMNRKKRLGPLELAQVLKEFVACQLLDPDLKKKHESLPDTIQVVRQMLSIVRENREGL